jgi:hypothetical protein
MDGGDAAGGTAGDAAGGTAGVDGGDAAGGTAGVDGGDASGGTSGNDASPDVTVDTGVDVAVDTGVDVAVDTGVDTGGPDAGIGSIVLNEIQPNNPDHVELYNRGATNVDLTGWTILDAEDSGGARPYTFPSGTTIAAGGYFTITTTLGFGLGEPDQVRLFNASGQVVDSYSWTDSPEPVTESFSRCPNGTGAFAERPETQGSPGTANDCPP